MTNDAPQPPPTRSDFMRFGIPIMLLNGPRSQTIEDWIQTISKLTEARVDWRQVGERAFVLALGNAETCRRVQEACVQNWEALVDMYMGCPYNFTDDPERSDVQYVLYDLEPE